MLLKQGDKFTFTKPVCGVLVLSPYSGSPVSDGFHTPASSIAKSYKPELLAEGIFISNQEVFEVLLAYAAAGGWCVVAKIQADEIKITLYQFLEGRWNDLLLQKERFRFLEVSVVK